MLSLAQRKQKTTDRIIYALAKADSKDFAKMSPPEKIEQKVYLAKIRARQIKANPSIYPDGCAHLNRFIVSASR